MSHRTTIRSLTKGLTAASAITLFGLSAAMIGCEDAGDETEDAIEETGDAIDDAVDETEDAVDDMG